MLAQGAEGGEGGGGEGQGGEEGGQGGIHPQHVLLYTLAVTPSPGEARAQMADRHLKIQ